MIKINGSILELSELKPPISFRLQKKQKPQNSVASPYTVASLYTIFRSPFSYLTS